MSDRDVFAALGDRAPPRHFRELAGFVILVPPEIRRDLVADGSCQLVRGAAVSSNRRQHDLRVVTLLIVHVHQADDDAAHELTAWQWWPEYQHVEGIAVVRDGLRHESVVDWIATDPL